MNRTTPDLEPGRQKIYLACTTGLIVLTVAYALWTNWVVFVGGNLPLTPIDLGEGSSGAGIFMLPMGDLLLILLLWLTVDNVLLNVVHRVLLTGSRKRGSPSSQSRQGQPIQGQPTQSQQVQTQSGQFSPGQQAGPAHPPAQRPLGLPPQESAGWEASGPGQQPRSHA